LDQVKTGVLECWFKKRKIGSGVQRNRAQGKRSFEFLVLSVELKDQKQEKNRF
jgi:hypothetical protein